jgi:small-conductance mechanosensitive channel
MLGQTESTPGGAGTRAGGDGGLPGSLEQVVGLLPARVWFAVGLLAVGVVLYFLVRRLAADALERLGVSDVIEGTAFERTARDLGTSTVGLIARLGALFAFGIVAIAALTVAEVDFTDPFWSSVAAFLPQLFLATLVLIVGIVIGDKVEVLVVERLAGLKLPQVGVVPIAAKYSVVYVAALVALSQLGVATLALVVLLAAYLLALIVFAAIASYGLISSSAAGAYLVLNQPYSIGDEIRVGEVQGIVQEVDLFVTHVDSGTEEHIIPNSRVLNEGVVRVRS